MDFAGTTNKDYVMINTMTFRLKTGKEVVLDRDYTGYTIEGGNLGMTWRGCYYWDGETASYLTEDDLNDLREADLICVDLEDDADEDYEVVIESWD